MHKVNIPICRKNIHTLKMKEINLKKKSHKRCFNYRSVCVHSRKRNLDASFAYYSFSTCFCLYLSETGSQTHSPNWPQTCGTPTASMWTTMASLFNNFLKRYFTLIFILRSNNQLDVQSNTLEVNNYSVLGSQFGLQNKFTANQGYMQDSISQNHK